MCNHYANNPDLQVLLQTWREYISWSLTDTIPPRTVELDEHIWPRREAAVVHHSAQAGGTVIDLMTWGVPLSLSGKRPGTMITKHVTNVRNLASPFWRSMLVKPEQRSLVPFTRFAEPKIGQGKGEHWFTITDRPIAAFAGVWRWAEGAMKEEEPKAKAQKVFAFLTCAPNPLVVPLHPKAMPVILAETDYHGWLTSSWDDAAKLAVPFPSQLMMVD